MSSPKYDVDTYLNPFIPSNPLHHLPRPISHFLGQRPPNPVPPPHKPPPPHTLLVWLSHFLNPLLGIALISAVSLAFPHFPHTTTPSSSSTSTPNQQPPSLILASFGAAAILSYNTTTSPLAQPRNLVLGHLLSALIGISVTKLFLLLPTQSQFDSLRWLSGALSVALASLVMTMTKTVHPPAGATALLAVTNDEVRALGWWLLIVVAVGCGLMLASALVVNNVLGVWPVYWWTPVDLRGLRAQSKDVEAGGGEGAPKKAEGGSTGGGEKEVAGAEIRAGSTISDTSSTTKADGSGGAPEHVEDLDNDNRTAAATAATRATISPSSSMTDDHISITSHGIVVPEFLKLSDWEVKVLQVLQQRIVQEHVD